VPCERLEPLAERPEAHDHQPGGRLAGQHERPRRQQQLHALGRDQLAHEDDDLVLGGDRGERRRRLAVAAREGMAGVGVGRGRRVGGPRKALAEARQPLQRRGVVARDEALHVDAGRPEPGPPGQGVVTHRLPQALGGVAGADEHAARPGQALLGIRLEPRMRLDDVLERAAVDLHRVRHAQPIQRPSEDRRPHDEVVRERDVRPDPLRHLPDRRDVALQVPRDLLVAQLRERPRLHALVAIGDVEREQPRDVRPVHRRAHRLPADLDVEFAAVPVARGIDPLLRERIPLLRQQVDLVAGTAERLAQSGVVHVRAGPPEEVAVEDEHAHGAGA
jgi:hypothetical protein